MLSVRFPHNAGALNAQLLLELGDDGPVLRLPVAEFETLIAGFGDFLHLLRQRHAAEHAFHSDGELEARRLGRGLRRERHGKL